MGERKKVKREIKIVNLRYNNCVKYRDKNCFVSAIVGKSKVYLFDFKDLKKKTPLITTIDQIEGIECNRAIYNKMGFAYFTDGVISFYEKDDVRIDAKNGIVKLNGQSLVPFVKYVHEVQNLLLTIYNEDVIGDLLTKE